MKIFIETERLILRELVPEDHVGLFELDSDPEVHTYLGKKPINNTEQAKQVINIIRQQYIDNGIGRWAVAEKTTGNFIGWAGLKLTKDTINAHTNYYDLGYRFMKKHWGQGFATEAAKASAKYGFETLVLTDIYGMAHIDNKASRNVLEKVGLQYIESFSWDGMPHDWFIISKAEWEKNNP